MATGDGIYAELFHPWALTICGRLIPFNIIEAYLDLSSHSVMAFASYSIKCINLVFLKRKNALAPRLIEVVIAESIDLRRVTNLIQHQCTATRKTKSCVSRICRISAYLQLCRLSRAP